MAIPRSDLNAARILRAAMITGCIVYVDFKLNKNRIITIAFLLFPLFCKADDVLTASFHEELDGAQVSLCFDGPAPKRLYRHKQASTFSTGLFHEGKNLQVSSQGSTLYLPVLPDNTCLTWQTDFTAALGKGDYRLIMKIGEDLVMSTNVWFWKGPMHRDLVVDIHLPKGMSISNPWKQLQQTETVIRFRPDKTSADWESRMALGQFKVDNITVPGANIRLAAPGNLSRHQQTKIKQWIKETVDPVTSVYGYFPQPQPQVLVIPIGHRDEAVVSASVVRGGGVATIFYIDENRPLEEFMDAWNPTHEFSHMLIPYVSSRDRWLSEGLASYYQNVLRARDGRLSETQAWQNLYDGFERGRKGTNGGSLAQATRGGRNSTMRVYWSGAALLLMADMQLRDASNGSQSLDSALQSLAACCMANGKTWRAREMFEQLDKFTGTVIFTDLYQKYVHSQRFPDMRSTWEDMGINIRYNRVRLASSAPLGDVREAIMQPY